MQADGVEFELHKQGMVYAARSVETPAPSCASSSRCASSATSCPTTSSPAPSCTSSSRRLVRRGQRRASSSTSTGTSAPTPSRPASPPRCARDGVEIQEGAEVFELVRRGPAADAGAHRRRRHRGRHRRARGRGVDDTRSRAPSAISIPMEPGKGYSFSVRPTVVPRTPCCSSDVHVGCTPLRRPHADRRHDGVQRHQQPPRPPPDRLDRGGRRSARSSRGVTPEIELSGPGCGRSRPTGCRCSTAHPAFDNTYIATGYSMQGVTLAPTVGPGAGRDDHDRTAPAAARAVPARPLRQRAAAARRSPPRAARPGGRCELRRPPAAGRDHRHRQHRHRPDDQGRAQPAAGAGRDGRHRSRVRRPAPGAASAATPSPTRASPACSSWSTTSTSRSTRPRPARMRSTPGCWPSAASAAST